MFQVRGKVLNTGLDAAQAKSLIELNTTMEADAS